MKKNKPALKPCPFCGEDVDLYKDNEKGYTVYEVDCINCDTIFKQFDKTETEAIEHWNSRPIVSGDGLMIKLEKRVYDVLLKNNADLMDENDHLREALEAILDATQKEKVSIPALRFVAYTALKGEGK